MRRLIVAQRSLFDRAIYLLLSICKPNKELKAMDKIIARWVKIPSRQRYLLIMLSIGGLVGGYYYFFHADLSKKLNRVKKQYRTLEAQRAEKRAYVDNLAKYEARLNELQQDLNLARAQLPDNADVAMLIKAGNKEFDAVLRFFGMTALYPEDHPDVVKQRKKFQENPVMHKTGAFMTGNATQNLGEAGTEYLCRAGLTLLLQEAHGRIASLEAKLATAIQFEIRGKADPEEENNN